MTCSKPRAYRNIGPNYDVASYCIFVDGFKLESYFLAIHQGTISTEFEVPVYPLTLILGSSKYAQITCTTILQTQYTALQTRQECIHGI